jgi:hypothetical protein
MSGTFFSVLSDVKQFFDYNYREVSYLFTGSFLYDKVGRRRM